MTKKETVTRKTPPRKKSPDPSAEPLLDALVIGAGFTGIGALIKLREVGITNIRAIERSHDVGGAWRDNTYPGIACDIPSHLYSYSFAQNPEWTRAFPSGGEIHAYIKDVAEQQDMLRHIDFGVAATEASFHANHWQVKTSAGKTYRARALLMATGPLANPGYPAFEGMDSFSGKLMHSSRWDHSYDLAGKRVAVIGTGASAIQLVPEIVKQAAHVKVFQRTPPWVLPRADFDVPEWAKKVFSKFPGTQKAIRDAIFMSSESFALGVIWSSPLTTLLERIGRAHIASQVKDRWMRRQVTPRYRIGCKRVLVSNDWYPALQSSNAKLITWPIVEFRPKGILTAEGVTHTFDCIIFATGFDLGKTFTPFPIYGVSGQEISQQWQQGAFAYKSISVSGYPNLFIMPGPNSGPGHNSYLYYMEAQIDYAVKGTEEIILGNLSQLDVKEDAQSLFNEKLQQRLQKTNWNSGCKSWYLTEAGLNTTMYPGFATQYSQQMKDFSFADYRKKGSVTSGNTENV